MDLCEPVLGRDSPGNSSPKFNYIKVQGDTPAQNDTINKNLLTFEKVARRKIRLALIARDERHAKGDVKVDYSSGSDNDEGYGLNLDPADVLDDGGMIVGDDHEKDQEEGEEEEAEDVPVNAPHRSNNGKGRARKMVVNDDEEDEEPVRPVRRSNKGKQRTIVLTNRSSYIKSAKAQLWSIYSRLL
ncbi:uncharacterized protein RSE6_10495 [Rhynchosporium secalis]|uniref:Uncharacterized protein n=1 Tax=Rhynchosporium secalis TaxID=38038 RepID=A0A1E1MKL8_RHYSE|nr:uncharacterized protein RSE6_10495 [Rhynchosporium secalis]